MNCSSVHKSSEQLPSCALPLKVSLASTHKTLLLPITRSYYNHPNPLTFFLYKSVHLLWGWTKFITFDNHSCWVQVLLYSLCSKAREEKEPRGHLCALNAFWHLHTSWGCAPGLRSSLVWGGHNYTHPHGGALRGQREGWEEGGSFPQGECVWGRLAICSWERTITGKDRSVTGSEPQSHTGGHIGMKITRKFKLFFLSNFFWIISSELCITLQMYTW